MSKLYYRTWQGLAIAALSAVLVACGSDNNEIVDEETLSTSDLELYELQGNVKECKVTTYYDVWEKDGEFMIDSNGRNVFTATSHFDEKGNYISKKHEHLKRDEQGRLVRWEDNRPNVEDLSGGFLKDTLAYEYVNPNEMVSRGMGGYSVVVFDDNHRVVGQYTSPQNGGNANNCAFNIYKKSDPKGNWTERVTIWVTRGSGESTPSVKYSIDQREITYY